jgi:putative membrane protein insertion efficiency factor
MKIIAIAFIDFWRRFISPTYKWTKCCRYHPCCSKYARDAYVKHGFLRGTKLTVWRLLRCNPFSKGGFDPCI